MKTMILTTLLALCSTQAFAGAGNTFLSCKNADGKNTLEGDVPGDFAEFNLTAKLAGKSGPLEVKIYSYLDQKTLKTVANGRIAVTDSLEHGVFTVQADEDEQVETIRLFALPSSVRLNTRGSGRTSHFKAKLSVSSENGGGDYTVTCSTDYSI